MSRKRVWWLWLAAPLALAPAYAHHDWGEYDTSRVLTLTGVIKESGYQQPHGHLVLEVPGKMWHVVLAPPSRMENRGLPASGIKAGKKVTVVAYPNRKKPDEARAERITVDGRTIELR